MSNFHSHSFVTPVVTKVMLLTLLLLLLLFLGGEILKRGGTI